MGQSETYTYNAAAEVTSSTDFLGNRTSFTYAGPFNELASITDANGMTTTLPVNNVGNFYMRGQIARPFKAKVVVNGKERAMVLPQMVGQCNSCHTTDGTNLAPGRIMLP